MKKITVIIPCYNVENYIDRCLTTIVNQTIGLDKLQLICVNDASTDNTWNKLLRWEERYPEDILLIDCDKNGRQGTARNIAFTYAEAPLVTYVDSDDWIEPEMYEKMYEKMLEYDCDIVFCRNFRSSEYVLIPEAERRNGCDSFLQITSEDDRKKFIIDNTIGYGCWDKLIKRNFLAEHNITFPENVAYEDIYWGSQLYLYAEKVYVMEEKLYHYFVNSESTVLRQNQIYHKDIFKVNEMKWNMYKESGFMEKYKTELEFDYLVTCYLAGIKILALRYTTDTYEDFMELSKNIKEKIGHRYNNPYNYRLSEFNQLQLKLLNCKVTKEEWQQLCHNYRKAAGI